MTLDRRSPRGRPYTDLAFRLRNWGWYYLVSNADPDKSDDGLDQMYFVEKDGVRARQFFKIRSVGSSPQILQSETSEKRLYDLVHRDARHQRAKEWFDSPLWDLLTTPSMDGPDFTRFLEEQINKRKWFRTNSEEIGAGRMVFADEPEPAFLSGWTPEYRAMLRHIAGMNSIDGIALLAALFREAHHEFDLDLARRLRDILENTVQSYLGSFEMPLHLWRCFGNLIDDRLLRNCWLSEADMPVSRKPIKENRAKKIRRFVAWYNSSNRPSTAPFNASQPIVLDTARTQWFRRNRTKIMRIWTSTRPTDQRDGDDIADRMSAEPSSADYIKSYIKMENIETRMFFDDKMEARRRALLLKLEKKPARSITRCLPAPETEAEIELDWDC